MPASFRSLIDEWVVRSDEAEALRAKIADLSRKNLGRRASLGVAIFRARATLGVAAASLAMNVILLVT